MQIKILTLAFVILSLSCKSQDLIEKDVVGKMTVIKASIANMQSLLNMPNANFDSLLTGMGYSNKEIRDGQKTFSKGSINAEGSHHISKIGSTISINWMHRNSITVLDNIFKQLQPFYVSEIKTMRKYQFTDGRFTYIFLMMRDNVTENVLMSRLPGVRGTIVTVPIR